MDKVIFKSITLFCEIDKAFNLFTLNDEIQKWLVPYSEVEPKIGGKYELFWDLEDKNHNCTIGCKITAIKQNMLLAFEWKGPQQFEHFMNTSDPLTHAVICFNPVFEDTKDNTVQKTEINLVHSGWRNTPDWDEAYQWFSRAWDIAFEELVKVINI